MGQHAGTAHHVPHSHNEKATNTPGSSFTRQLIYQVDLSIDLSRISEHEATARLIITPMIHDDDKKTRLNKNVDRAKREGRDVC